MRRPGVLLERSLTAGKHAAAARHVVAFVRGERAAQVELAAAAYDRRDERSLATHREVACVEARGTQATQASEEVV